MRHLPAGAGRQAEAGRVAEGAAAVDELGRHRRRPDGAADSGAIADGVECYAELAFNQNKLAQIAAPVGGIIQTVDVDLGTKVEEKQTVAKIWSASIAEAVAKAVLSHQTLDRERKLRAERVTSEKDLQQAEAEHRAACQQLRTLGFTEEQIDVLGAKPQEQVLMEVRAPFAGEIVERTAVRGALVEAGKSLFTLADRSIDVGHAQHPGIGAGAGEGGADGGTAGGVAAGPDVHGQADVDRRGSGRDAAAWPAPAPRWPTRTGCSRPGCSPRPAS